jgi:hypothetical protein
MTFTAFAFGSARYKLSSTFNYSLFALSALTCATATMRYWATYNLNIELIHNCPLLKLADKSSMQKFLQYDASNPQIVAAEYECAGLHKNPTNTRNLHASYPFMHLTSLPATQEIFTSGRVDTCEQHNACNTWICKYPYTQEGFPVALLSNGALSLFTVEAPQATFEAFSQALYLPFTIAKYYNLSFWRLISHSDNQKKIPVFIFTIPKRNAPTAWEALYSYDKNPGMPPLPSRTSRSRSSHLQDAFRAGWVRLEEVDQ